MRKHRIFHIALVLLAAALLLQSPLTAAAQDQPDPGVVQDQNDQSNDQEPPTRVARLNYSSGAVSFQPGGEGDWVTAVANRPLTTGDNLWADQNSRAELHIGSSAIRMNSETSLTFLDLNDQTTQLRLSLGTLLLRVRHLDDGDLFEVDTPNLAFTVQSVGEYRIDVNSDGNQTIAAASGLAAATPTPLLPVSKPHSAAQTNSITRSRNFRALTILMTGRFSVTAAMTAPTLPTTFPPK